MNADSERRSSSFTAATAAVVGHAEGNDPFSDELNAVPFFAGAGRGRCLNLMLHLASYGGVLLLLAEKGAGKTALLHYFMTRSEASCRAIGIDASVFHSADLLMQRLQDRLSWQEDFPGDAFSGLCRYLEGQRHQDVMPVLLLDNAHDLDADALAMLGQLTGANKTGEKLITLVLAGEPLLKQRLADEAGRRLQEHLVHSFELQPFSEQDISEYIAMRLSAASIQEKPNVALLKYLHIVSRGMPGGINEHARMAWSRRHGSMSQRTAVVGMRRWLMDYRRMFAAVALLSVLGYVVVSYLGGGDEKTPDSGITVPVTTTVGSQQLQRQENHHQAVSPRTRPENGDKPPAQHDVMPVLPIQPAEPQHGASPGEADKMTAASAGPDEVLADEEAGQRQVVPARQQQSVEEAEQQQAVPAPREQSVAEPVTVDDAQAATAERDEQWLLAQNPAFYTAQLLAMDKAAVLRYVTQHKLQKQVRFYRTRKNGVPLLVLVSGIYESRAEALAAAKVLQQQLPGVTPWVRTVASIQQVIRPGN